MNTLDDLEDIVGVDSPVPEGVHVTLLIRLTEDEALRFRKLLTIAMADDDQMLLTRRIIASLEAVLPAENIRLRVRGHLFAVYMDKNLDAGRYDYQPTRSDA